jgi:hypothetical protein
LAQGSDTRQWPDLDLAPRPAGPWPKATRVLSTAIALAPPLRRQGRVNLSLINARNCASRIVGVIVSGLAALAAFAWLPRYPVWGVILLSVSVAVIWALTVSGRDVVRERPDPRAGLSPSR